MFLRDTIWKQKLKIIEPTKNTVNQPISQHVHLSVQPLLLYFFHKSKEQ